MARSALGAMCEVQGHRGPDDAGCHVAPGIALGSTRLAILDLSAAGHMPMYTPDRRFAIVYNGEIYNFRELRAELAGRGHRFHSGSDTEVLLRLYADEGPAMLGRLNGMFALAIWDAHRRSLLLARDRLGVKPLYYAHHDGALVFASEAKALLAAGVPARFDRESWTELLCFRFVAGAATPLAGIERLLPGHYLVYEEGRVRITRWWHLGALAAAARPDAPAEPRSAARWFRDTFDDAVRLRRIADVPLGVLLSGGLDSSSVAAALASQAGPGVAAFTVRFDEPGYDEGELARAVAARWGLTSHELRVHESELPGRLRHAAWLNDEPLAHGNEPHLGAIAELARPVVTVLLSGEGADETLGGYVRYRPLRHPRLLEALGRVCRRAAAGRPPGGRLAKLARLAALPNVSDRVLFNACDVLPGDLVALGLPPAPRFLYRESVLAEAAALHPHEPMRQAMYLDQHTFLVSLLERNDRMTMGASIECRVPFLDFRLVEGLAAMPSSALLAGRSGKPLLRRALGDRLPRALLRQPKWGFGTPWAQAFRRVPALRDVVLALPTSAPVVGGPLEPVRVARIVREFLAGDRRHDALMRQLVMITTWYQAIVEPAPAARSLDEPEAVA